MKYDDDIILRDLSLVYFLSLWVEGLSADKIQMQDQVIVANDISR